MTGLRRDARQGSKSNHDCTGLRLSQQELLKDRCKATWCAQLSAICFGSHRCADTNINSKAGVRMEDQGDMTHRAGTVAVPGTEAMKFMIWLRCTRTWAAGSAAAPGPR